MATWTYNTSPFDDIGRLRLMIGDTDIAPTTDAQFSNEELQEFITQNGGNLNLAAIAALEAWMGALSRKPSSEKIGDYSYTIKAIDYMKKLKDQLEEKEMTSPILEISEMDLTEIADTTVSEDIE